MTEDETARSLATMMREMGIESLSTPGGYTIVLGDPPSATRHPGKPVEPKTEKETAEEEEALLFGHLG
jgi:hypothetical protein